MLRSRCGKTAVEAITAATGAAADDAGIVFETGRVHQGLVADVIAVDGDPMTDLRILKHPSLVMAEGVVVHKRCRVRVPDAGEP